MPTIAMDKEEIKALIDISVKQSVKEALVELIKSKDENMLELIEDVTLGMIMEEDKKMKSQMILLMERNFANLF